MATGFLLFIVFFPLLAAIIMYVWQLNIELSQHHEAAIAWNTRAEKELQLRRDYEIALGLPANKKELHDELWRRASEDDDPVAVYLLSSRFGRDVASLEEFRR